MKVQTEGGVYECSDLTPKKLITVQSFDDLLEMPEHVQSLIAVLLQTVVNATMDLGKMDRKCMDPREYLQCSGAIFDEMVRNTVSLHNGRVAAGAISRAKKEG